MQVDVSSVPRVSDREESLLAAIVDSSDDAIISKSLDGTILSWNPGAERIFGYTAGEAVGRPVTFLFPPDRIEEENRIMSLVARGERVEHFETVRLRKDGKAITVSVTVSPVRDASGAIVAASKIARDITRQKKHDEELQDSEESFRLLFAGNPHPMWVYDRETLKFIEVNDAATAKYGYAREEFLGMRITEIRPEEDIPHLLDDVRKERPDVYNSAGWRHRLKDGTVIHVDIMSHVLRFSGRQAVLVVAQDITGRKAAEEKLRESREYLTQIIDCIADPIFVKNDSHRFLYVNTAQCDLAGASREEMLSRTGDEFFPKDQVSILERQDDLVFETGVESVNEEVVTDRRGMTHVMVTKKRLLTDRGGQRSIVGVMRDMTEWKRSEEALRLSEERFRLISENVEDLIAVLDLNGNRVYNSPSYGNILGDPASLRGSDSFESIHPDDRERVKEVFQHTARSGIGHRTEFRLVSAGGRVHHIESQGSVIRNKEGKIANVIVVSRDVTAKKVLEQQLLRSQRLESLGTLASGIAHDLNNVLAPILLSIELLKKAVAGDAGRKTLQTLEQSAQRGRDIIKQVLTFGSGMTGERSLIQLRHVVKETVSIISQTFPKSVVVSLDLPHDNWAVEADATQLHQLLMNLCVNARDAMPEGGTLRISVRNVTIDAQYAQMNPGAREGEFVMLTVEDTGTGMDPETADRIFDPFFTTKPAGKGTGLGLSTVHTIVKNHGGFINVYSEPGKGTAFRIHLRASRESESSDGNAAAAAFAGGRGELILVIDDEASIREITKQTLDAFGYRTITATNGAEGVALFRSRAAEIALVITDMMMPGMDGVRTIRVLRSLKPALKIIGSSGLVTNDRSREMGDLAPDRFIAKPYTAETLLHSVNALIHSPAIH
jgi:PAS domain S-box-containing protein